NEKTNGVRPRRRLTGRGPRHPNAASSWGASMDGTAAAGARDDLPRSRDRAFLGHPSGFGYLAFTEAWERFSYYGMQALLVLYMVDQLLLPGHAGHVLGLGALK